MKFWSWTMTMPSGTVFSWRCNRQAMRSVLQLHGLEAFLQLKRKVSAIVISDLNMPEGSGFEFLSQIFPALQAMIRLSYFDMPIIGVARSAEGLYRSGGTQERVDAEDFCEFCRLHPKNVVGNRLTKERLDFIYHLVFPPSQAELLPVREAKKGPDDYEVQLNEDVTNPQAFAASAVTRAASSRGTSAGTSSQESASSSVWPVVNLYNPRTFAKR